MPVRRRDRQVGSLYIVPVGVGCTSYIAVESSSYCTLQWGAVFDEIFFKKKKNGCKKHISIWATNKNHYRKKQKAIDVYPQDKKQGCGAWHSRRNAENGSLSAVAP